MNLILASKSPRRQELLQSMGIPFRVELRDTDESFSEHLSPQEAVIFISEKKASAFLGEFENDIVLTADTIVTIDNEIIGKPIDREDAILMLQKLSGRKHQVITAVTFLFNGKMKSITDTTDVYLKELTLEEIQFYIDEYKPFDKAGAYGIQEWIGLAKIEKINGSYTNVVGLPTEKVYGYLKEM